MNFEKMLTYTEALSKNNNRTWFHDNHRQYEEAKEDFLVLLDVMKFVIAQESPATGDSLTLENPKNFMYRIPRDMRYSSGKEPYIPAFRAYFSPRKKDFLPISYYLHISHERCTLGTGAYPWRQEDLTRLREFIACNYEELESIVLENGIELYGEKLRRVPRGFEATHPAAELLKCKQYLADYSFTAAELHDFNTFTEAAGRVVRRFEPLRLYLNAAFGENTEDIDDWY